jgi:hypothetical protein
MIVSRKSVLNVCLLTVAALLTFTVSPAFALSSYKNQFNTRYGTAGTAIDNCALCHPGGSGSAPAVNTYGQDWIDNGKNSAAFAAIEGLDSDGDGFTNIDEITARTFPGDSNSKPAVVGPTCTDKDGDGFFAEGGACGPADCNDNNPAVNPAAAEICSDSIDNNCNNLIDAADPSAVGCSAGQNSPHRIGTFRDGKWYFDTNGNYSYDAGTDVVVNMFGVAGDIPVTGDWNGDGFAEIGVFRKGTWYLDTNGNGLWEPGVDTKRQFGMANDTPVTGDWNGDGTTDIGVFRSVNDLGYWYLDSNGSGSWDAGSDQKLLFGTGSDIPVTGDWNGDGSIDIGVYRNGTWFMDMNGNRTWEPGTDLKISGFGGVAGDIPVPGDWNGDGSTQLGVYRNGSWYIDANGNDAWDSGADANGHFGGMPSDIPVTIW